jgi:hypothetical protein
VSLNRRADIGAAIGAAIVAVTCLLAVACGGGEDRPAALAGVTPVADAADGQPVLSVVAPNDEAFRVMFAWRGAPGGKMGTFVWSQAGGARRWDFAPEGGDAARIGWFSVEKDFSVIGAAASDFDCLWERTDPGQVRVGCDAVPPNRPGADALTRASMVLRISGRLPDRTIAGRTAACYAFQETRDDLGALCVEEGTGVPLYFAATGTGRNKSLHEFEATAVLPADASVVTPDLALGTILNPARRHASDLLLPSEIHVAD